MAKHSEGRTENSCKGEKKKYQSRNTFYEKKCVSEEHSPEYIDYSHNKVYPSNTNIYILDAAKVFHNPKIIVIIRQKVCCPSGTFCLYPSK